ncbi:hypothetical protein J7K24_00325 [bacterium]|nr:hypothetical protein [bacterium]
MTNIPGLENVIESIISLFTAPPFSRTLLAIKTVFVIFSLYFLAGIIYFASKTHYLQWLYGEPITRIISKRPYGIERVDERWKKIVEMFQSDSESNYKLAVVEADALLDKVLKKIGYKGDTLEEKLQKIGEDVLSKPNEILSAHRICSDIIRDPSYSLSREEAKKVLLVYKRAFKELDLF